jgi:hypothetical protein
MLSVMCKVLCCAIFLLCCLSGCVAQSRWALPKLQELTDADELGRGAVHLSAAETQLLKNLTRRKMYPAFV